MDHDLVELVGVYDADATLLGEVAYWIGARLGRRHCSLCELTHGSFMVKPEWTECTRSLGVPFATFHRDDAPDDVLAAAGGRFPVVLARSADGLSVALDRAGLEAFGGSTAAFVTWVRHRVSDEDS